LVVEEEFRTLMTEIKERHEGKGGSGSGKANALENNKALALPESVQRWEGETGVGGPKVLVLGGIHGNETLGIVVVERLQKLLNLERNAGNVERMNGTLTVGLGNLKAIGAGKRFVEADMNRLFDPHYVDDEHGGDGGDGDGGEYANHFLDDAGVHEDDEVDDDEGWVYSRAKQLAPILKDSDVLIDLHATNKPSRPFIRVGGGFTDRHLELCRMFPCNTLVLDPNFTIGNGRRATTDEYVGFHGGVGLCYESGQASDMESVDEVLGSVLRVLKGELGLSGVGDEDEECGEGNLVEESEDFGEDAGGGEFEVYEMFKAVTLRESGFAFGPGGEYNNFQRVGEYNFQKVKAGEEIGRHFASGGGSEHSDDVLVSDGDVYLLFPKVKELWSCGKPIVWLCKKKVGISRAKGRGWSRSSFVEP